jgi:uncharacterized membrane protein YbhN (UPF0104 family)
VLAVGTVFASDRWRMRTLRWIAMTAGALVLAVLVYRFGAASVASAVSHVTWAQFALICLVHTMNVGIDACAWRYAFPREAAPYRKLVAARCAGDAVNVVSAVAAVGGEAVKAWLLRSEVPYRESVPSLIVAKTAEVVAQTLLLALGLVLAVTSAHVGRPLTTAMASLLAVEIVGAGGFLAVQVAGGIGKTGRLVSWAGVDRTAHVRELDDALRRFYRRETPRFLASVGLYLVGWLLGAVQGFLILRSLGLPASLVMATIIEALWSGVRFATFFVPASLGTLEGATAAAFGAFGFGAGAGIAFTLVRRAAQAVWVGIGAVVLVAMRPARPLPADRPAPIASTVN